MPIRLLPSLARALFSMPQTGSKTVMPGSIMEKRLTVDDEQASPLLALIAETWGVPRTKTVYQ